MGNALAGTGCIVGTSNLRLEAAGLYTYPDLVVICGEPRLTDHWRDTITNPIVIAEVLSPSTESYDRGFKFAKYREIESLQEYALISHAEPRVEIFRRRDSRQWLLSEVVGLDGVVRFDSLNCSVALAEICANVTFGSEEAARPAP
jgi:Uma2 family endonuclease